MNETYYVMALVAAVISVRVIYIAIVRLSICRGNIRPRIKYTFIILCTSSAALQPYFLDMPALGRVLLTICLWWVLTDGASAYRTYKNKDKEQNFKSFDTRLFDPKKDKNE